MKEHNYADLKAFAVEKSADLFGVTKTARIEKYIDNELKSKKSNLRFYLLAV